MLFGVFVFEKGVHTTNRFFFCVIEGIEAMGNGSSENILCVFFLIRMVLVHFLGGFPHYYIIIAGRFSYVFGVRGEEGL